MDVLSAVSSVVAVIQIADRVISLCKTYMTGVQDAPADLRAILIEVGSVKCVLETLDLLASSQNNNDALVVLQSLNKGPGGPLEGCRETLKGLEALFPPQAQSPVQGKRQRIALSLASLAWPFKRDRACKLLDEIARHKATISLGLTTEAAQDLKHIRNNIEHIRKATEYGELDHILKWLVTTDPSSNHNSACYLHEPYTGKWLTKSPEYENWKSCSTRFLWLHGIPGAGKTVLLSYIAEDVKSFCKTDTFKGTGFAYYYCYFARSQDETPHLLRWVINQLCRQIEGIPVEVRQLFRHGGQPSTSELLNVLAAVIQNFTQVYLVIDALDESSEREKILNFLRKVVEDNKLCRIQLLATSRKQLDIEGSILGVATDLSLSNLYVDEDIRTYILSCLRDNRKFSRWPDDLRMEIETALVTGARGMFRWVVCQLDILKRLDFAADIRVALSQLPKTLDETYERILGNIPSESQVLARKTLHLLSSGYVDDLESLLHLLAVDLDRLSYSKENRPLNRYAPIEVCTCLVTYNDIDDTIKLAHYTVKEYIMSTRIAKGPASLFHVTRESLKFLVAMCLIIFLLDADYDSDTQLMESAILDWDETAHAVKSEPSKRLVQTLILKLLDPTHSHFQNFVARLKESLIGQEPPFPTSWKAAQGDEICITLAYLCWYDYIEAAEVLLEQQTERVPFESPLTRLDDQFTFLSAVSALDDIEFMSWVVGDCENSIGQETSTLVHIATMLDSTSFLDLFISKGADLNVKSPPGCSIWVSAVGPGLLDDEQWDLLRSAENCQDFVSLLVANNVSPNLSEVSITPLQMATRQHASSSGGTGLFVRLLASGAAVNGVADDKANLTRICDGCHWYFHKHGALESNAKRQSFIETALHRRGKSWLYDTPLRILDNKIKDFKGYRERSAYKNMLDIRMLLESNGAKSLHLFPIPDLPGYCNEDMEEWLGSGSNERNAQSLCSDFPQSSSFGQGTFIPGRVEELDDSTADEFEDFHLPIIDSSNASLNPVTLPGIHSVLNAADY